MNKTIPLLFIIVSVIAFGACAKRSQTPGTEPVSKWRTVPASEVFAVTGDLNAEFSAKNSFPGAATMFIDKNGYTYKLSIERNAVKSASVAKDGTAKQ